MNAEERAVVQQLVTRIQRKLATVEDEARAMKARAAMRRPSLTEACERAGLAVPRTSRELAKTLLQLVIAGVAFDLRDTPAMKRAMLYGAPRERRP